MIIIISPSKTQDFTPYPMSQFTHPRQLKQSLQLINELIELSPEKLTTLMKTSEKLSLLNWQRFQNFNANFTLKNAKQALLAFKGDVYKGFSIETYTSEDFNFAQQHLRILSGLYGVLRPLDLIQPYRLEMGIRLKSIHGKNLYEFWGDKITQQLNEDLTDQNSLVINLASNEYFKAIKLKYLKAKLLTLSFKENKQGVYKVVAIYAKHARGLMADFIIKNRLNTPESLKRFNLENYQFNSLLSSDNEWVFSR